MPSSSRTTTSPRPAACATLSTALAKPDSPSRSKSAPARNSTRPWNAAPPICCSTTSPPMKPPIGSAKSPAAPRSNSPAESPLPTSATMPTSAPTSSPPAPSPTPPAPWTSASAWSCYDRLLNCGAARQAVGRTPWSGCPLGQDALVPHPDQRWQHHAIRRRPWGGPPGRGALWARTPSSRPRATAMIDLARLRQAFPERHILYFESLDSTQRVAAASQPGAIVLADRQLAGQGRHGHTWHSEPGVGIYCSPVLPPSPVLTLALGIATVEAIAQATGIQCDLRWPNDLMLDNRKAAGILVQLVDGQAIAGIGINVNQTAFPGDIDRLAISLRQHAGREFAREDILFALFPAIDSLIAEDPETAFPGDIDRLAISLRQHAGREFAREDILFALFPAIDSLIAEDPETVLHLFTHASSYVAGRRVTVDQPDRAITGTTAGLDPAGFLIVRQDDGTDTLILAGGVRAAGS